MEKMTRRSRAVIFVGELEELTKKIVFQGLQELDTADWDKLRAMQELMRLLPTPRRSEKSYQWAERAREEHAESPDVTMTPEPTIMCRECYSTFPSLPIGKCPICNSRYIKPIERTTNG